MFYLWVDYAIQSFLYWTAGLLAGSISIWWKSIATYLTVYMVWFHWPKQYVEPDITGWSGVQLSWRTRAPIVGFRRYLFVWRPYFKKDGYYAMFVENTLWR